MHRALAAAVLTLSGSAFADAPRDTDHVVPCRPTVSCTADLAAPGALELEAGYQSSHADPATNALTLPFLLKLALTKMLQIQLGSNGYTAIRGISRSDYLDNIFLGTKLHVVDQSRYAPSFAITVLVSVPTFPATGYTERVNASVTAHASKDLGPIHADLNVGALEWGIDSTPVSQALVALAFSMSLPPPFGIALESYYFSDSAPIAPRDGGVRFAINATPKPWLVFDFGGDVGFFPSTRAFTVFFGVSIVPIVFWR